MPKCSPPKSVSVRDYWRSTRRKKAKAPAVYYVAEDAEGRTCSHKHRTSTAASRCAQAHNRHVRRRYGGKHATYITKKVTT